MDKKNIRKIVADMDEETELTYLEEIIKKKMARLEKEGKQKSLQQ